MAIFGRSKKSKSTTPAAPLAHTKPQNIPLKYSSTGGGSHGYSHSYPEPQPSSSPPYRPQYVPQNSLAPPPQPLLRPKKSAYGLDKLWLGSATNLLANSKLPDCPHLYEGAALYDSIAAKFNAVVTQIDSESFSGKESDLAIYQEPQPLWQQEQQPSGYDSQITSQGKSKGMVNNSVSSALTTTNYFSKVNLYANSRLPPDLPPMKLYIPTFPLLCLAAQYSERVYTKPAGQERETHVDSDWRMGTKAMVIKSVPMDDMNVIVFAIRGTQTFMDWAVNLKSAPVSPQGFLDDPGNLCHAGFLSVAKKMVKSVAARLRYLLLEDPSRSKCSLLITGHSAGGAVAALLYSHMLATTPEAESELNILTGCFKRIHCISFGAPPISLLPIERPNNPALRKSVFLSFVNEGDPVPRADKEYVRSLLNLYSTPAPGNSCIVDTLTPPKLQPLITGLGGKSSSSLTINKIRPGSKKSNSYPPPTQAPHWPVPVATLSNAGRLVLLRAVQRYETRPKKKKPIQQRMDEGVVAQMISDEELRGVIWGDPVCHMMRLYARRIEVLATNAVIGR
ncbi:Alpha/Beta hydrolase protein [Bisporella sp. PMI_857]|nr:Alpha/Beta hydrolase protein [Bisporella sp. PMI_857]